MHTQLIFVLCLPGMKQHRDINRYLNDLDNEQIVQLGLALGLNYTKLKKMRMLPADMVAAWLRKEDDVLHVGEPAWKVLCEALKDIGQTGLAIMIQKERQNGSLLTLFLARLVEKSFFNSYPIWRSPMVMLDSYQR